MVMVGLKLEVAPGKFLFNDEVLNWYRYYDTFLLA